MSTPSPSTRPASQLPIAVIGGGATGLAAAHRLAGAGKAVRLFEAGPGLGGAVGTTRLDGWLIESGPNSLQENTREVVDLISELGLAAERVEANPASKKRFIVRGGRACAVPMSPAALARTDLFSARSKLRLLTEPFSRRRRRTSDVSLASFVRDHFGDEIVDYALNPVVSGIYAGDPNRLSARVAFPKLWACEQTHGSLIRGQIAQARTRRAEGEPKSRIISFRGGLQVLTDALAASLPRDSIECGVKIESLLPGKPWRLVWSRAGETHTETFSHILLAIPAPSLAQLSFGSLAERPLACLEAVEYPPVMSLFLGYRRDQVEHPLDGFGALVPAAEKLNLLGVLFSSTLFPGRAPDGHVALTVMVGGALRPDLARQSPDDVFGVVAPELGKLLGVRGDPVFRHHHFWPRAIPQYQLGYERHLEVMARAEKDLPGLLIGGNTRDGISLPNCLASGRRLAAQVLGM